MSRRSLLRHQLIAELCPRGGVIVDVGADHGNVAHAVGGIATEREPQRRGRPDVPWVITDGLTAFHHVDVAILAGMGAYTILRILDAGPRPSCVIAHAPDEPRLLRRGLADRGWHIEAERLAPEGPRFAEVIRAVPGEEPSSDLKLEFGPRLRDGDDPHLRAHLQRLIWLIRDRADKTAGVAPERHAEHQRALTYLQTWLDERA